MDEENLNIIQSIYNKLIKKSSSNLIIYKIIKDINLIEFNKNIQFY